MRYDPPPSPPTVLVFVRQRTGTVVDPLQSKMPKYVVSDSQDETQRALDPDGANAKVSFNNSEAMPAREKSRISRGKWSQLGG